MHERKWAAIPMIPVAWGEVFDKLTILQIKLERIADENKKKNVLNEMKVIDEAIGDRAGFPNALDALVMSLKRVNDEQWDIQEGLRDCERTGTVGQRSIDLVRAEYRINDQRAAIKRQINELLESGIFEEKSYAPY